MLCYKRCKSKVRTRPSSDKKKNPHTPSFSPHREQWAASPTQASSHTHSLIEPSGQLEESPASPAMTNSKAMSYTTQPLNSPCRSELGTKTGYSFSCLPQANNAFWVFLLFLWQDAGWTLEETSRSPSDIDECRVKEKICLNVFAGFRD